MEHNSDDCTEEDRDFIVDDGDNYDEDPTYVHGEEKSFEGKYVVRGKDFDKLKKKAKKLGAKSLDYSKRKNNKYVVTLPDGKNVHFGSPKYSDFLIHKDEKGKNKYLARAKKIENKLRQLTYEDPKSANYWSVNLLWS